MNDGIAIIILAAGESARMGKPKQLLPFNELNFIEQAFEIASQIAGDRICIVLGAFAEAIITEAPAIENKVQINEQWKTGLGSSIRTGLSAITENYPDTKAVVFTTCDMPDVTTKLLQQLIDTHFLTGKQIVASSYGDTAGIPVLFASSLFPVLFNIEPKRGAKHLIDNISDEVTTVAFPAGLRDIDTPDQYTEWKG